MFQNNNKISSSLEKISSGMRINRAGDDAAGLSISEKMRAQIRGLNQKIRNVQDAISLVQTADGALEEDHAILQRMREICIQASNDSNTTDDRKELQKEINQLTAEVDRISENTEFNTIKLLNKGDDVRTWNAAYNTNYQIYYYTEEYEFSSWKSADAGDVGDPPQQITAEQYETYKTVIDNVIDGIVNKGWLELAEKRIGDYYGLNGAVASGITPTIRVNFLVDAEFGTLASVSSSYSNNGSSVVAKDFILNIDLADFTPGSGDSGSNTLTSNGMDMYNDRILAHEMVHALLANYITSEQVGVYGDVPTWFNEGCAELIHGADERLAKLEGGTVDGLSAAEIGAYMDKAAAWDGGDEAYAGGYLMVRALAENGTDGMDTLKNIFNDLETAAGNGLTDAEFVAAVNAHTNFASTDLTDLQNDIKAWAQNNFKFDSGTAHAITDTKLNNEDTGAIGGTDVSSGAVLNAESIIDNSSASDTDGQPMQAFNIQLPDIAGSSGTGSSTSSASTSAIDELHLGPLVLELKNVSSAALAISGAAGAEIKSKDGTATAKYTTVDPINKRYALDISTHELAAAASKVIDDAINDTSAYRGELGAIQNRMEHTMDNYSNCALNLQAAESRIRDADIAREMMQFTKYNILQQAAQAILAQANQAPRAVLQLLN